jgi:hypothetical protein
VPLTIAVVADAAERAMRGAERLLTAGAALTVMRLPVPLPNPALGRVAQLAPDGGALYLSNGPGTRGLPLRRHGQRYRLVKILPRKGLPDLLHAKRPDR